ncbi:MAG: type IV pilus twitching motility protein PilT [Planctomycetota bacterium]|nr:MAG: type IV pilus twitching motility protein PilT [Planctomycetota bacterium]
MARIDRLFLTLLEHDGSDLHLLEGQPPKLREHGHIVPMEGEAPLTHDALEALLAEICPPDRWESFLHLGDMDFAYALGDRARFRANYFRHQFGYGAVFRVVPSKILSLEDLAAPPILREIAAYRSGLVLVTGPTGSGKSTTLAALLDHLNTHEALKVLTLEEPVEFLHRSKRSLMIQREIGEDTETFASGLRAAIREDCDVILVGEMRDLETISLALSAAETGTLVYGTLHTNSAAKTVDRIVNVFPPDQQGQILSMLSTSLRAVVSQQLLRKADGSGRVAVHEVLVVNTAARAAIREGRIARLNQVIASGKKQGMQSLDAALLAQVKAGVVAAEDAYLKASDKKQFERMLAGREPYRSQRFQRAELRR